MPQDYLPKEIIKKDPPRNIIGFIFLVFFFILIFNSIFYFYLKNHNPNLGYVINEKKWTMLEKLNEKKDWLILGDSTCNQGLSVSDFENTLNSSAINLCTIGDMLTIGDSWMLERYMKKFGPPKNVLLIHTYNVWYRDTMDLGLTSQLPIISLIREKPEPWIFNTKEEAILLFYKYFPLYSQKSSLLEIIVGFFQKKDFRDEFSFDNGGFMSMKYANPEMVAKSRDSHKSFLENNSFEISKKNMVGLENILQLSKKYDFKIFLANGPINNDLSQDKNFQSYIGDAKKIFNSYENKNFQYLENISGFPDREMLSSDHITANAAKKYSREIAENLEDLTKNTPPKK